MKAADEVRSGPIDQLAAETEPEFRQELPIFVKKVAPLITPVSGPFTLVTVGSFRFNSGPTTKTFIIQGGSGNHWAVIRVVLRGVENSMQLAGVSVTPFNSDPSKMDNFDINRQGMLGYAWLTIMLAGACTCIWATILVWRRRWLKRRWLWTIGSVLGFARFALNWSTGAWAISLVNVSLLGAQATKAGPYAPWVLSFGVPIVAIIVLVRWHRLSRSTDGITNAHPL